MHVDKAKEEGQSMLVTNKDAAILEELLRTFKLVDLNIAGICMDQTTTGTEEMRIHTMHV